VRSSSTTRRAGYVTLTDIAPEALAKLGVAIPDSMGDTRLTSAADGRSAGPTQRLTTTKPQSLIPEIHPWRDGFAIAWSEVTFGRNGGHAADTRSEVVIDFVR